MKYFISTILIIVLGGQLFAQNKALYEKKFVWDKERTIFSADFDNVKKPELKDFSQVFHLPPVRQDTTGTCWAFSTTSFLESEIYRLHHKKIKLSEMYTVYWEYVEKARRYVREKGDSEFGEGSESNAVLNRMRQYGCVPKSAYNGLVNGQTKYNHEPLHKEMFDYLKFLKKNDYWDEDVALTTIKSILNKYMGQPPATFEYKGKTYTPQQFRDQVCGLNPDDYVGFMSTMRDTFYTLAEYKVPDNWWHSKDYHNVPLDVFYKLIKRSINDGYSMVIGGDVSEPGRYGWEDIAIIVPWDIPYKYIDQNAREMRIYNHTSQDDHGIHLVGYVHKYGHDWFLIKDSASSAYYGQYKGYYFFRDDFVKLKMLTFMIHKDAVKDVLAKFKSDK